MNIDTIHCSSSQVSQASHHPIQHFNISKSHTHAGCPHMQVGELLLEDVLGRCFFPSPLTGAVEDVGNSSPAHSSCFPAQQAEQGWYLWGGWKAPFRNRGVGRLPAVVLCLPVLCGIACVPSAERVVAQYLFQSRGQWAGRSEVLGGKRRWGRDGNGGWSALHPGRG